MPKYFSYNKKASLRCQTRKKYPVKVAIVSMLLLTETLFDLQCFSLKTHAPVITKNENIEYLQNDLFEYWNNVKD